MGSIEEAPPTVDRPLDPIISSFVNSQSEWLDEPVLNSWKNNPSILQTVRRVSGLHRQWSNHRPGPFSPDVDPLWLEAATILCDAGLPWQNGSLNMPENVDQTWPFSFGAYERHAVLTKGMRAGCPEVTGYITNWMESNLYGIRAAQQELRVQFPFHKPLLVGCLIEVEVLDSSAQLFGLETVKVAPDWKHARKNLLRLSGGERPIIFAATLGNSNGQVDDFEKIGRLGRETCILLHVDASRTFDHITTTLPEDRRQFGIPELVLQHPFHGNKPSEAGANRIVAATIVAGGTNCLSPCPTTALKHRNLGDSSDVEIEYVRAKDSTICGYRDTLVPLWVCLQELRFGAAGLRQLFNQCAKNRMTMFTSLVDHGINVTAAASTLDLIVRGVQIPHSVYDKWGIKCVSGGEFLLTVQPSVTHLDMNGLMKDLTYGQLSINYQIQSKLIPLDDVANCQQLTRMIKLAIDNWRSIGGQSGGYPLNQAPYSALGPLIRHFFSISFPPEWIEAQTRNILGARRTSLGVRGNHGSFPGCFTSGGTMGNRVGIHTALLQYPGAFIYYSSATHYSVHKVLRDNDEITHIWDGESRSRSSQIPADDLGRMIPEELAKRALEDRAYCESISQDYQVILHCSMGTTFVGGRDDIIGLRQNLAMHGIDVSFTFLDGALELGFTSSCAVLGPPGTISRDGVPIVQGISLSHHKVYGMMVSGEVICYNPTGELAPQPPAIDPRTVFEVWLFQQMYLPKDLLLIQRYCMSTTSRLRATLAEASIVTRFNPDSNITLLERIPPWLVKEFHLAPERDWVHYITMPHINHTAVDNFVGKISAVDVHFQSMFTILREPLEEVLGQQVNLKRVRTLDGLLLQQIATMVKQFGNQSIPQDSNVVDWLKQQYIHQAMSFVVMSKHKDSKLLVAFLVAASATRNVILSSVLTTRRSKGGASLEIIGRNGLQWLAESMDLNVLGNDKV